MGGTGGRRWLKRTLIGSAIIFVALVVGLLWLLSDMFSRGQTDQEYAERRFRREQQFEIGADFEEEVDGLLLIAPSIDPSLEERRWYNWLAALPGLDYLLPEPLINSNREIFPLKRELQKLRPKLANLNIPAVVIQGDEDGLVPPGNADFVKQLIPNTRVIRVPGVGHGILWQRRDLILREALALLARISEETPGR